MNMDQLQSSKHATAPTARGQRRFGGHYPKLLASLGFAAFLFAAHSNVALAQTAPPLGSLVPFGIVSSTYVNTAPGTNVVNGGVCYTTGPVVPATATGATGACPGAAGADQGAALATLNGQLCTPLPAGPLEAVVIGANPPGTIPPGCYSSVGAISITANGIVTLTGNGVYVFKSTGGAVNTGANSQILLAGGACAGNVFWAPVGAATLGATSAFVGNILDAAGITIGNGATLSGRALAFGGTVSTDASTISVPAACAPIPPGPPGGPGSVNAIPTLSEWAMILLAGILGIGAFAARRREQRSRR